MKLRMIAAVALAAPTLALAQGAAQDAPQQAPPKAAAKGTAAAKDAVARVNGVPVPKARMEAMLQQQQARGTPVNEQTRAMVRDELVNREIVAQEAVKTGLAKSSDVQTQIDLARQEILVGAYIREWLRKHPITDAEIQQEYERARDQTGDKE